MESTRIRKSRVKQITEAEPIEDKLLLAQFGTRYRAANRLIPGALVLLRQTEPPKLAALPREFPMRRIAELVQDFLITVHNRDGESLRELAKFVESNPAPDQPFTVTCRKTILDLLFELRCRGCGKYPSFRQWQKIVDPNARIEGSRLRELVRECGGKVTPKKLESPVLFRGLQY